MASLKSISAALLAGLAVLPACTSATGQSATDADALRQALDDEYRAEAIYAAVIEKFGEVRPFTNIIQAEQRHSERAKAQMDRLGIEFEPVNPFLGTVAAPASVLEACKQAVEAEIENIALYDRLLPVIEDPQVRETLTALQSASRERHLPAFERCVARGGEMGPRGGGGQGQGQGRGHGQGHGQDHGMGQGPGREQ